MLASFHCNELDIRHIHHCFPFIKYYLVGLSWIPMLYATKIIISLVGKDGIRARNFGCVKAEILIHDYG